MFYRLPCKTGTILDSAQCCGFPNNYRRPERRRLQLQRPRESLETHSHSLVVCLRAYRTHRTTAVCTFGLRCGHLGFLTARATTGDRGPTSSQLCYSKAVIARSRSHGSSSRRVWHSSSIGWSVHGSFAPATTTARRCI